MRATAHPSPNTHSVTSSWQLEICCDGVLTLCMCAMCVVGHFSSVWLFVTPWTVAYQVPLSTEFSRQELKRVTMPSSRGSSQPRDWTHISLLFLALAGQFFTTSTTWEAFYTIVVVQWLSCNWLSVTPWTAACQASLSIIFSQSLFKLMSTESVMSSNHLIFCLPLLLLPSIFPSTRVFSNESALHIRWPKYWSFCIGPSHEHSRLNSFKIDWFDLLAVPGTTSVFPSTTVQKL